METTIITFFLIFVVIAGIGIFAFQGGTMLKRLTAVISPETKQTSLITSIQESGFSLSTVVEQFEKILPRSQAEVSVVQKRLIRAGYRNDSAVKVFYGMKTIVPVLLVIGVFFSGLAKENPFVFYIAALGLGFLGPDFWLGRQITSRQARIRRGLPDVLDLLVICIEAGLSLDQSVIRTSQELQRAQPALCDELGIVVLEQRAGRPRSEAWKHLAERTDVDSLRNLVTVLVQSEQFGTSIAKTLRTHSDTLRTQRIQQVEEMAAKTTVKLIFPLVLFIFPSLFLVVLGPAAILMSESFQKFFSN